MNINQTQPKFNYGEALQKSNLFYYAQRSGNIEANNPFSWRGNSALNDGADVGRDLSGGYYDAGDHVKFGLPMAASMTMLSWGAIEYRSGYEKIGQLDETLSNIKWGTDYLLKAYDDKGTATVADDVFWGQVGNGGIDHAYWGSPENMTMSRPSYKVDAQNPGSDVTGETAAALASASIVFRATDAAYADLLLDKAQQLYQFAEQYQGKYSDSIADAANYYNSWSGYQDELAWGAVWLHKAIQAAGGTDTTYLSKAETYYNGIGWTQDWDNKTSGTAILLARETGKTQYKQDVERWLDSWADPNGSVQKTSGGLAWLAQWGSLRYAANTAFLAGIYGDTVNDNGGKYTSFAESQINYILGDNPRNSSYMVGFGENSPQNPHHRAASGTTNIADPNPNKYTLYGALVGGPTSANDLAYNDRRTDYTANEVALDYNAGLTGALARMTDRFGGQALTAIPGVNLDVINNPTLVVGVGNTPLPVDPTPIDPIPVDPTPVDPIPVDPLTGSVNFSVLNQWNNGFTGNVQISNNTTQTINGWELVFNAPFEITNIWNATIQSDLGDRYVINDLGWDGIITPGGSIEFGFNASNSPNINLALSNVTLNGVAIAP